jgi:hypothetical protein
MGENVFGAVKEQINRLRNEIEKERGSSLYRGPTDRERLLMEQLSGLLAREEEMERQRSRVTWLREGDRNTGFFQAKARARGRTNRIHALKWADGSLATDQKELEAIANTFYQNLFCAQDRLQPELVCKHVPVKVNEQMNEFLVREFTPKEVEEALFHM